MHGDGGSKHTINQNSTLSQGESSRSDYSFEGFSAACALMVDGGRKQDSSCSASFLLLFGRLSLRDGRPRREVCARLLCWTAAL